MSKCGIIIIEYDLNVEGKVICIKKRKDRF